MIIKIGKPLLYREADMEFDFSRNRKVASCREPLKVQKQEAYNGR
jgi:hypothetical protein